jgi:VWFA-related protein
MTRRYIISSLRASVIAALLATAGAKAPLGQDRPADQAPTFRSRTDLVQLDVSVLDSKGLPVRGLTAEEFTILEDGVAQPVVAFAAVDVPTWSPAAASWTREVGPDVVSNRLDAQRAVVIVLDDFNTRRDPGITKVAKSVGLAAIDQLGPADLAAVVYVVNRASGQEFTLDRARLRAAVERFLPSGLAPPPPDSRFAASIPTGGLAIPSRIDGPSGACLRNCVVMALRNIGDIFAPWPGARKTVMLISPAEVAGDMEEYISQSDERSRMFAALQQANVNVYQFDPHGLVAGPRLLDKFGTFAENTGGRAVVNTNAPADFVPQVFRENSSYYLLGFRPADANRDGRFHKTKVQVTRPGVHVRARAGYYAATDRPQSPAQRQMSAVDRALSGGLPTGDLPISLMLFPFATTDKAGAALAVVARLDRDAGIAPGTVVDLTALAFNDKWKEVASVTQRFMLPPASDRTHSQAATRLNLPPGRYEIRAAVKITADDRTGSVYGSITIPNFARDELSLSGIALERQSGGTATNDDLTAVVPAGLTTIRVFSKSERVAAAARVYQRRGKPPGPVHVVTRIVDAESRTASTTEATLAPAAFDAHQASYRLDLPLDRLAAGEYLLTLDASTTTTSARRDLRFSVRD